ncbi:MAG TPA: hypothetical protein VNR65_02025, partial [Geobacterales bacterium]|nr:hypothetical protein [Geobacterales bacterium]
DCEKTGITACDPMQKMDAIVQAEDSPSLIARLRFPLDPKEETWRPTSQRAVLDLLCRSTYCVGNESLGEALITAAALSVLALISDANFL